MAGEAINPENIFTIFHQKVPLMTRLKGACNSFQATLEPQMLYGVTPAKIENCDAQFAKPFSKAFCSCEYYHKDPLQGAEASPDGFGLYNIFEYGFDVLESFMESPECIPEREGAKLALAKLLAFFENLKTTENALKKSEDISEAEWTVLVTHHLLSKLSVYSEYKLDNASRGKVQTGLCTCGCGESIQGRYDDTSIGLPKAWHGRIDVLMEAAVNTQRYTPFSESCSEVKNAVDLQLASKYQMRALAIVFAFWKQKKQPKLRKVLIPTIAVSKEQVAFLFYDSVNDYLLESPCFDLFIGNRETGMSLNLSTVIALWLSLNYKYFCSGVSESIEATNFTADFFRVPILNEYRDNVTVPCDTVDRRQWFILKQIVVKPKKREREDVNKIYCSKKQKTEQST